MLCDIHDVGDAFSITRPIVGMYNLASTPRSGVLPLAKFEDLLQAEVGGMLNDGTTGPGSFYVNYSTHCLIRWMI